MTLCELLTANRIYISLLHMGDENRPQMRLDLISRRKKDENKYKGPCTWVTTLLSCTYLELCDYYALSSHHRSKGVT